MLDLVKLARSRRAPAGGSSPAASASASRSPARSSCRPKVLLLDEPLGALDLKLREQMQVELKALQREVGISFVYVTHDQGEALSMSDRVAVFNQGRSSRSARRPRSMSGRRTRFVADFVGGSNVIEPAFAERLGVGRRPLQPPAGEDRRRRAAVRLRSGSRASRHGHRTSSTRAPSAASRSRLGDFALNAAVPAGGRRARRRAAPVRVAFDRSRAPPDGGRRERRRIAGRRAARRPAPPRLRPAHAPAAALPLPAARAAARSGSASSMSARFSRSSPRASSRSTSSPA